MKLIIMYGDNVVTQEIDGHGFYNWVATSNLPPLPGNVKNWLDTGLRAAKQGDWELAIDKLLKVPFMPFDGRLTACQAILDGKNLVWRLRDGWFGSPKGDFAFLSEAEFPTAELAA